MKLKGACVGGCGPRGRSSVTAMGNVTLTASLSGTLLTFRHAPRVTAVSSPDAGRRLGPGATFTYTIQVRPRGLAQPGDPKSCYFQVPSSKKGGRCGNGTVSPLATRAGGVGPRCCPHCGHRHHSWGGRAGIMGATFLTRNLPAVVPGADARCTAGWVATDSGAAVGGSKVRRSGVLDAAVSCILVVSRFCS